MLVCTAVVYREVAADHDEPWPEAVEVGDGGLGQGALLGPGLVALEHAELRVGELGEEPGAAPF